MLASKNKEILFSIILLMFSSLISLFGAEIIIRLKNSKMDNYDIEMWRYSNLLKRKSNNLLMDFEHQKNKTAKLQKVDIRINNFGLRGADVSAKKSSERRILFLGGSITLGWGVEQNKTITSKIQKKFNEKKYDVEVLNAGIGNYNATRYITRYFTNLEELQPTDIVIHYFLRDAENLKPAKQNILLKNSQVAVTAWTALNRLFIKSGENVIENHYRNVYQEDNEGFIRMKEILNKLAKYAKDKNIKLYLAMTPDITNLIDYKFTYIHQIMKNISNDLGYEFIDTLPSFRGIKFEKLYAMPGDPHPNALGHKIMADVIFPVISKK